MLENTFNNWGSEISIRSEQWEWVDYLLNGIDVDANQIVQTAKSIIRFCDDIKADLTFATNKCTQFIAKETPMAAINPHHLGISQISNVQGQRGQGQNGGRGHRGSGRGRNDQGQGNYNKDDLSDTRIYMAGIDVTNLTRDFTNVEWNKLRDVGYTPALKLWRKTANNSNSSWISLIHPTNEALKAQLAAIEGLKHQ